MDTEAQNMERDCSSRPSGAGTHSDNSGRTPDGSEEFPDKEEPEGRSRFALVPRAAEWLPGGWISLNAVVCLLFLLLFSTFVIQPFQIPSSSMESGLRIGDRVLVNKLAYRFGSE